MSVLNTETPWTQITYFRNGAEMQLLGSINGIVCLSHFSDVLKFILWNPATQQRKSIKFRGMELEDDVCVGFGYDSVVSDFRIICIFPTKTKVQPAFTSFVHSCNGASWKEIKPNFPYNFTSMMGGVTVKGNPCWMGIMVNNGNANGGADADDDGIMANNGNGNGDADDDENNDEGENIVNAICVTFDVQSQVFYFKPLPKSLPKYESYTNACLTNLKDSLAYVESSRSSVPNKLVDVYVLDDKYGTWSKIYGVGPIPLEGGRILPCFRNGDIVVEGCESKLFLYNPVSKAKKDLCIGKATDRLWLWNAYGLTESLVTI